MPLAALLHEQTSSETKYTNATVRIVKRLLQNFQGDIALRLWNGAH